MICGLHSQQPAYFVKPSAKLICSVVRVLLGEVEVGAVRVRGAIGVPDEAGLGALAVLDAKMHERLTAIERRHWCYHWWHC